MAKDSDSSSSSAFSLPGVDSSFSTRSHDIFGALDTIESKHKAFQKVSKKQTPEFEEDSSVDRKRHDVSNDSDIPNKSFKSSACSDSSKSDSRRKRDPEFSFKRPRPPLSQRFRGCQVPDHKSHPERWTKYDLSDVSDEQMSDRSNASAAFAFLKERQKLHDAAKVNTDKEDGSNITDEDPCSKGGFKFRKPSVKSESETQTDKKVSRGSGGSRKVVMEEYVIGVSKHRKQKSMKAVSSAAGAADKVGLTHIGQDSEDNDDTEHVDNSSTTTASAIQNISSEVKNEVEQDRLETKVSFKNQSKKKSGLRRRQCDSDEETT